MAIKRTIKRRRPVVEDEYDEYDDEDTAPVPPQHISRVQRAQRIGGNVERLGRGLPMVFVGLLCLAFFVMASVLHIQTTEAFFLSLAHVGLSPDWSILNQPYEVFTGKDAPQMAEAVISAWIVELTFLILTVGYEYLHSIHAAVSPKRAAYFKLGIRVLVVLDGYSDFAYGSVSSAAGWLGQFFFACLMGFAVLYLGTSGYHMVLRGLKDWSAANHE